MPYVLLIYYKPFLSLNKFLFKKKKKHAKK